MSRTGPAVELVTIGDELLLGDTVDGNGAWIGRRLCQVGIRVVRRSTVGDEEPAIRDAVMQALDRTGVAICTGGLGPTRDDLTKPVVAALFRRSLVLDAAILEDIRERFRRRGIAFSDLNRGQAEVPEGAIVLPNARGTAPGLALEDDDGRLAVLLPGVPHEMRHLMDEHVVPYLLRRWPQRGRPILHRRIRTTGIPESTLAERIDDIASRIEPLAVAFLPAPTGVDLRITSWAALDERDAVLALDSAETALRERVGRYIYGQGDEDLVDAVARALEGRGLSLAVAESCTGGLVAARITSRAGASEYFRAGVVAYANDAKERLLGVGGATIAEHGAVSERTAVEMVNGVKRENGAQAGIAVTGVAGPGGGTPDKPVGTVWIAASVGERVKARNFLFPGDRDEIRERSAQAALALLWTLLRDEEGDAP